MKNSGDSDLLIRAREALLDVLTALHEQIDSVVVVGAQAIYLHTGSALVALAEATKDSDLALDTRTLRKVPLLEQAMRNAGFVPDPINANPGAWINEGGIPVDLMVPEAIAGGKGSRSVSAPPHDKTAMRRAVGLEAAVVDNSPMLISSLLPKGRSLTAKVASPAALLVAKLHKISDRRDNPLRLIDKDAHDIFRILVCIPTEVLSGDLIRLCSNELAGPVTLSAISALQELFAAGSDALGSVMAGRAEELIGDPVVVAASVSVLAQDLMRAIDAGLQKSQ
jgi:predicted nucleotidyltransferase